MSSSAKDHLPLIFSLVAAILIVGGGAAFLLSDPALLRAHAAHGLAPSSSVANTTPTSAGPSVGAFRSSAMPLPTASDTTSSIYRCVSAGRITYSDTPCRDEIGRTIDVLPTEGFSGPSQSNAIQPAPAVVADAPPSPTPSTATEPVNNAAGVAPAVSECTVLDEALLSNQAASRRRQSMQMMDWLNAQRRKILDRKYELKC